MAVFTREEVKSHVSTNDGWVVYKGAVVNISSFIESHPGGSHLIKDRLGTDISEAFDKSNHSIGAYQIIQEYTIGTTPDNESAFAIKDVPKVDPTRSVVSQVFELNLESYKAFINHPSHINNDVVLFDFVPLEVLSRMPLHILKYIWLTAAFYYFWSANLTFQSTILTTAFVFGLWTLIEYFLNRFLFHMELFIPDNPYLIVLHFLFNGVHRAYPFDKLRLPIFQPLSVGLYLVFRFITWLFLPEQLGKGVFAALLLSYVCYENFHLSNHFEKHQHFYASFMKTYHLKHHFRGDNAAYGVTNKIWDVVFGTDQRLHRSILAEVKDHILNLSSD